MGFIPIPPHNHPLFFSLAEKYPYSSNAWFQHFTLPFHRFFKIAAVPCPTRINTKGQGLTFLVDRARLVLFRRRKKRRITSDSEKLRPTLRLTRIISNLYRKI